MPRMRRNKPAHFRVRAKIIARLSARSRGGRANIFANDGMVPKDVIAVIHHKKKSWHLDGNVLGEGGVGRPFL